MGKGARQGPAARRRRGAGASPSPPGRKAGASAGRAERRGGRRLRAGAPGAVGRGGGGGPGWRGAAGPAGAPPDAPAAPARPRPLAPGSPCQLLRRPSLFVFVVATLRPGRASPPAPLWSPPGEPGAPRAPLPGRGARRWGPLKAGRGAAARPEGVAGGWRRRRLVGGRWWRLRGWRGFIYLPWNQSLQISHSIMKRFTSYGCRHTQYTGGGGGGAEARPGAATDTAAAAAPAAAPAATAAAAPAIFKKHTHARSLLRSPTGASAAASQRRLLQQPRRRRRRRRLSARARGRGGWRRGRRGRARRARPRPGCFRRSARGRASRARLWRRRALPAPLRDGRAEGAVEGHAGGCGGGGSRGPVRTRAVVAVAAGARPQPEEDGGSVRGAGSVISEREQRPGEVPAECTRADKAPRPEEGKRASFLLPGSLRDAGRIAQPSAAAQREPELRPGTGVGPAELTRRAGCAFPRGGTCRGIHSNFGKRPTRIPTEQQGDRSVDGATVSCGRAVPKRNSSLSSVGRDQP